MRKRILILITALLTFFSSVNPVYASTADILKAMDAADKAPLTHVLDYNGLSFSSYSYQIPQIQNGETVAWQTTTVYAVDDPKQLFDNHGYSRTQILFISNAAKQNSDEAAAEAEYLISRAYDLPMIYMYDNHIVSYAGNGMYTPALSTKSLYRICKEQQEWNSTSKDPVLSVLKTYVSDGMTPAEAAKTAARYEADLLSYDNTHIHTAMDTLTKSHAGACYEYAEIFSFLISQIPFDQNARVSWSESHPAHLPVRIFEFQYGKERHARNIVTYNNQNYWYDVCWYDTGGRSESMLGWQGPGNGYFGSYNP